MGCSLLLVLASGKGGCCFLFTDSFRGLGTGEEGSVGCFDAGRGEGLGAGVGLGAVGGGGCELSEPRFNFGELSDGKVFSAGLL